jgi:hypothetical protein
MHVRSVQGQAVPALVGRHDVCSRTKRPLIKGLRNRPHLTHSGLAEALNVDDDLSLRASVVRQHDHLLM